MFRPILAAVMMATASPAYSATLTFIGALTNDTAPPTPSPLCPTGQVRIDINPNNSAQTSSSNFGSFAFSQAHCITLPPTSYSGGIFEFAFAAGDRVFGSYSGFFTLTDTPGLLNSTVNFAVTGGNGRFVGATGLIQGLGLLDVSVPRPFNRLTLNGTLNTTAVPEPATWALMIGGFVAIGGAMRRRRPAILTA